MGIRCNDSHVARMGQRKQSLIPERELSVSLNPLPPVVKIKLIHCHQHLRSRCHHHHHHHHHHYYYYHYRHLGS